MATHTDDAADCLARYRPALTMLARMHLDRRLWRKIDPEDLVQQTYQEAWARWDQFRGETEAQRYAWLQKALLNNLYDAMRHYQRQKCDVAIEQAVDGSTARLLDSLAVVQSSPSQRAARNEDIGRLAAAIARLTPLQQEAVVLHHLHGLKLVEVAEHLGRTLTATAGLVHCGLKRLRKQLAEGEAHA